VAERLRAVERSVAWVRLGGVAFAALEVGYFTETFPEGYRARAVKYSAEAHGGTLEVRSRQTKARRSC
jgi:hypothetical protein